MAVVSFTGFPGGSAWRHAALAQDQPAQDQTVPDNVLTLIEDIVGLPSEVSPRGLRFSLNSPDGGYREGDFIEFYVTAPDYDGFLYLDYYQIDGNVVHIMPGPVTPEAIPSGVELAVGTPEWGVTFEVLPPFGRELLVLMAAPQRLFDEPRREFEYAPTYLEDLRAGIDRLRQSGQGELAVLYRAIQTHPKDAIIAVAPETPNRPKPAVEEPAPEPPVQPQAQAQLQEIPPETSQEAPQATTEAEPSRPAVEASPIPDPAIAPEPQPASQPATETAPVKTAALPATQAQPVDEDWVLRDRIGALNERMRVDPNDMEVVRELATSYRDHAQLMFDRGEFDKARFSLSMVSALDVTNSELVAYAEDLKIKIGIRESFGQGLTHLSNGRADLAYESFQSILVMDPENADAQQRIAEITPDVAEYYHKEALAAARRQNLDQAVEIWDKVLVIYPEFEVARLKRSEALRRKKMLEQMPRAN